MSYQVWALHSFRLKLCPQTEYYSGLNLSCLYIPYYDGSASCHLKKNVGLGG